MTEAMRLPGNATAEELREAWLTLQTTCFSQHIDSLDCWVWSAAAPFDFGQLGLLGVAVPEFSITPSRTGLAIRAYGALCIVPWAQMTTTSFAEIQVWMLNTQREAIEKASGLGDRRFGLGRYADARDQPGGDEPTVH